MNRSWRKVVGDEVLWKDLLRRDYGMTTSEGPDGALEPKFRHSLARSEKALLDL